jgi:intracellular sulfur oxidation DsrE/DsrF family protein
MMRTILIATVLFVWATETLGQPAAETKLIFPLIPKVGGVVPMPRAAEQPRKGAKLVIDITADCEAGEVNKGLKRAALVLNLYGSAGLKASDVKIIVVFHGKATKCVLSDEAYMAKVGTEKNPNLPVIRDLHKAGVALFVCGQALNYSGFKESDVAQDVTVALSAVTLIVNRQTDRYAFIPVP